MSPRGRLTVAIAVYLALIAYSYTPVAYRPRDGAFPLLYVLLVAGALIAIGYLARSYLILLLPVLLVIAFAVVNHGTGVQAGFALLITIVILLPANEALLAAGVYLARRASW